LSKKAVLNGVVALLSLVLGAGAVEIGLRVADVPPRDFSPWIRLADTGFGYAPGYRGRMRNPGEYDVAFATNALGLRNREVGAKRGFRVLTLGDSFTSGYGVEQEATFVDRLERDLGVEIINASVGGYEIIHQVHYYGSRGRALEPDLVLYPLYLGNDLSRNGEWRETADGGLSSTKRVYPVRQSREWKLPRLIGQARYALRLEREAERTEWTPFPDYLGLCARTLDAESLAAYEQSEDLLTALDAEVRASGARLVVALFTYRTAIEPDTRARFFASNPGYESLYDLDRPVREIRAFLEQNRIEYVDLNPALRGYYATVGAANTPLYFSRDGHFSVRGHEIVATELAAYLREHSLVPPPSS
jgi:lysophospholipase L1-like esterase